jgi:putative mRNA 3-end processing factor
MKPRHLPHSFVYRAGIGLAGTHITCDARGFPSDLIFVSHARALAPKGPIALASARAGRRQIVTTELTLRLLGDAGEKLRSRALPAAFGRPFNLGDHRIEVVPTGHLPGSAALLCEGEKRRIFYLGAFCPEPLWTDLAASEVRGADAVCVDATFGDPRLVFPPRGKAIADIRTFVKSTLGDGRTPVLLASPFGALAAVARDLIDAGLALRAHPRIAVVLARLRAVGERLPTPARFAGRVTQGEVLLWPPEARYAESLAALDNLRLALVSGSATETSVLDRLRLTHGFALTNLPSSTEILAAIAATGAREVALFHGGAEPLAALLRERGLDAYTLEPPRQMTLPGDLQILFP